METSIKNIKETLEKNLIPMLLGEPGTGKLSCIENLSKIMHTKCFVLACNQLDDKADLITIRITKNNNEIVFYPHEIIKNAITYAEENPRETPILVFDELNRTTPDVISEIVSIIISKSIGSKKLPDNLKIIITGKNGKKNVVQNILDDRFVVVFNK